MLRRFFWVAERAEEVNEELRSGGVPDTPRFGFESLTAARQPKRLGENFKRPEEKAFTIEKTGKGNLLASREG